MKGRICLCPASISWIIKHLKTSAKGTFRKMIATQRVKAFSFPKRKSKRRFSAKQLKAQRLFAKRARAGTLRGPIRRKANLQRFKRRVSRGR